MPDAIQVLEQEHRAIERVIARAQDAGERLERGELAPLQKLGDILDFLRTFVDGCHRRKEEDALVPILAAKSALVKDGPVQALLAEHRMAHGFIENAERFLREAQMGKRDAAEAGRMLLACVKLLRRHISREEVVLFRMARSLLSDGELRDVQQRFDALERPAQRLPRAA